MPAETQPDRPTVAVIGASPDRHKYGNKSLRAHLQQGYEVYPVNPNCEEVEGIRCYAAVGDVPVERITRVTMYVPPQVGMKLLEDIAAKGCDEFWLNPGSESDALIAKAEALGLRPILACSIVDLGVSPAQFRA